MKNIYYIEDTSDHFSNFYDTFGSNGLRILPELESWQEEMQCIKLFLQNQSEDNEKAVISCLEKYNIDLFVIDVRLFHAVEGGKMIYNEILMEHPVFKNKKFIFLTIAEGSPELNTSQSIRHCLKIIGESSDSDIDFKKTFENVHSAIMDLLNIRNSIVVDFFRDIFKR